MKSMYAVVAIIGAALLLLGTKTDPFGVKYELSSLGQGQPQVVFAASGAVVDGYQPSLSTELTWVENSTVSHLINMNDSIRSDISEAKRACMANDKKSVQHVSGGCDLESM
jgi:hypothetical protein|tara:strand:+ start:6964 stop:7296 length:333 start_codon:yes stop_codon:yes gene_type:complete